MDFVQQVLLYFLSKDSIHLSSNTGAFSTPSWILFEETYNIMEVLLLMTTFALVGNIHTSPAPQYAGSAPTRASCTAIASIFPFSVEASSFCYTYLGIPTTTVTSTDAFAWTLYTVTVANTHTSILFSPGNDTTVTAIPVKTGPAHQKQACTRDACLRNLVDTRCSERASSFYTTYTTGTYPSAMPSYLRGCSASRARAMSGCSCAFPRTSTLPATDLTSSACSCLKLSPLTTSLVLAVDYAPAATVTCSPALETVYPCATAPDGSLPSPGPAYGKYQDANKLELSNKLLHRSTPQGASAQACCNACFFEEDNCIQAWWYDYEGCVISQATNLTSASGHGLNPRCPAGTFNGLTYIPDFEPPFRSTGDIAGSCGVDYSNA